MLINLQIDIKTCQLQKRLPGLRVAIEAVQHLAAGPHQRRQIATIIVFPPETVMIRQPPLPRQGLLHGFMQSAKIIRVLRCAAVAKIVQIITDGLIRDNKFYRLAIPAAGNETAKRPSFTVKSFSLQAGFCLPAQLVVGDHKRLFFPDTKPVTCNWMNLHHRIGGKRYEACGCARPL